MDNDFSRFKRLVIIAYRLPFRLVKKKDGYSLVQNSGGLVSAILSLSQKLKLEGENNPDKLVWIGMGDKKMEEAESPKEFRLHPVIIPREINEKYYEGFCNNTIWPLFHYFPSRTSYEPSDFEAYVEANNLFFKKVKEVVKPGDFVWVHDYQLFLLPQLIRKRFPESAIGFFLHIPFPSFEMFRLLPKKWRIAILDGMTGADVTGFHTNDYSQHFIKSVKRTLGYKVDKNNITIDGRICKAETFPIGIDFTKFREACFSPKVKSQKEKLKKSLLDNKLVFSIDRLDYSKGFLFRLKAYERFLEKYPQWHYKVIFNMIVIPSRDTIEDYRIMKTEIEAIVGRINGKYSTLNWRPIIYQYKSINFQELVAIYNISDAGLLTPLRDGMNLVAKEFISCQVEDYGMLVLSELAGAASELNEAILINPVDLEEIADAIDQALTMPVAEKKMRVEKMQGRLSRYDVFRWASDFFQSVDEVKDFQKKMKVNLINEEILNKMKNKYLKSKKRLFLIDYDGTLTPIAKTPEMATLNKSTRNTLEAISSDRKNKFVIISGRDKDFMEAQFKDVNVILIAEHGYFVKYPGGDWERQYDNDFSWKEKIEPLLEEYVDRCSGSMIEEKYSSIVWHYRNAEEDMASLRINELRDDLSEILRNEPKLHILEGDKVIEVKSIMYDKGVVASEILKKENYDFILAIGDDHTDEDLFKIIPDHGFSVKVGSKLTNAKFNTKNQHEVMSLLKSFA
jgi:trehalose 6-phosphate synthase/phosphatase